MVRAVVDGVSEGVARVLVGDDAVAVYISTRELPPGTREGTVLRVGFTIDQAATRANAPSRPSGA
jgi:hypothetical protein